MHASKMFVPQSHPCPFSFSFYCKTVCKEPLFLDPEDFADVNFVVWICISHCVAGCLYFAPYDLVVGGSYSALELASLGTA